MVQHGKTARYTNAPSLGGIKKLYFAWVLATEMMEWRGGGDTRIKLNIVYVQLSLAFREPLYIPLGCCLLFGCLFTCPPPIPVSKLLSFSFLSFRNILAICCSSVVELLRPLSTPFAMEEVEKKGGGV